VAEGDAAFGEIVWRQFHGYLVARQNSNTIAAEAPGQVRQNNTVVLQLDSEQPTGEFLENGSGYFDAVFFTQRLSLLSFSPIRQPAVQRSRPADVDPFATV
jgi:hypothetical protein